MTNAIIAPETALKIRQTWQGMHSRCYFPKTLEKHPSYVGCSVHQDWHDLSNFQSWMLQQDYQGKSLDKDILVFDNKIYSVENCIFVTHVLNNQLRVWPKRSLPLGVVQKRSVFQAIIRVNGAAKYLGTYKTPYEAHRMWQVVKADYLENYSLEDESPSLRPRLRIALDYRAQRIRNDLANNRITERP